MSLSGCEQEETNKQLKEELQKNFPMLSSNYVVCSDTVGSIAAALENGMYQFEHFLGFRIFLSSRGVMC
jgi:hypothetical protein